MNIDDATLLAKLQATLGNIVDRLSKIAPEEPDGGLPTVAAAVEQSKYMAFLARTAQLTDHPYAFSEESICDAIKKIKAECVDLNTRLDERVAEIQSYKRHLNEARAERDKAIAERDYMEERYSSAAAELDEAKIALAHEQAVSARVVEERDDAAAALTNACALAEAWKADFMSASSTSAERRELSEALDAWWAATPWRAEKTEYTPAAKLKKLRKSHDHYYEDRERLKAKLNGTDDVGLSITADMRRYREERDKAHAELKEWAVSFEQASHERKLWSEFCEQLTKHAPDALPRHTPNNPEAVAKGIAKLEEWRSAAFSDRDKAQAELAKRAQRYGEEIVKYTDRAIDAEKERDNALGARDAWEAIAKSSTTQADRDELENTRKAMFAAEKDRDAARMLVRKFYALPRKQIQYQSLEEDAVVTQARQALDTWPKP